MFYNSVMVDLETLGVDNDAAIVSIGAFKFDMTKEQDPKDITHDQKFYVKIDWDSALDLGFTFTPSTIKFWLQQSDEARQELLTGRVQYYNALQDLREFIPTGANIFGNGATFDNVLLRNAFKKVGVPYPVSYRQDLCYRTLKTLFPDVKKPHEPTVKHNALDDAISQGLHLQRLISHIRGVTHA